MSAGSTIDEVARRPTRETGRGTNPLRPAVPPAAAISGRELSRAVHSADRVVAAAPAVVRQSGQLPGFAPLLEELEIAGWSSDRLRLSGNFHDWLMLEGRRLLVSVGQAVGPEPTDPTESALVAQAAWSTIRAHAHHVHDAGELLSMAARSLWPTPDAGVQAAAVVALVDTCEGTASVAMAGDCLAWRVRAATSEQLATHQPMLGGVADFAYASQFVQLSLRERLLLVADHPLRRAAKLPTAIETSFSRIDAESHRRMLATDAVALVRRQYERGAEDSRSPASIIAVRRR